MDANSPAGNDRTHAPWIRFLEASRRYCTDHPGLFFPLKCFDERVNRLKIRKDSDLLLEGFPRSGNTFSVVAFEHLQGRELGNGHHLHTIAHIRRAIRFGKPILIVIRNPEDVVTSASLRMETKDFAVPLVRYIHYHQGLQALTDHFVLATFEEFLKNPVPAIHAVNRKFGTSFKARPLGEEDRLAIRKKMEEIKEDMGLGEMAASLPSDAKNKVKEEYLAVITARHADLLAQARDIYEKLSMLAKDQG
ncbi:MAG: hypothetical protein LAT83_09050 [Kiritimatiellae bacterium]|nr:hypothetical protein [Kiritimatiellia bacterium]